MTLDKAIGKEITLKGRDSVRWVSQNQTFNFDLKKDFIDCDNIYWADGDHFSTSGEIRFGKRLPEDFIDF